MIIPVSPPFPAIPRRSLACLLGTLLLLIVSVLQAHAAYEGPVPAAADAFGRPGPYPVRTETFPSPRWADRVVTVYRPEGAAGPRPIWFFTHGFAGVNTAFYGELLTHLASHGAVVVFSPYPADLRPAENYETMYAGFVAAVERLGGAVDTTRIGFAGHSFGAGAIPSLALRALRERSWGQNGLALLLLAPWYSFFVSDTDLASFPAHTQAVVQIYEDDVINDHRMAIDVFTHLNLTPDNKDFLLVRSDRIEGYNYRADHNVPTGAANPRAGTFNALDSWAVARIAQALAASAWQGDPNGRDVALGNGSAEQVRMGASAGGRVLRPMIQSDAPVPLYPPSRYREIFDDPANPRRRAPLHAAPSQPHLGNLSVRAPAAVGAETLIVGTTLAGTRPNSLLVRAVGPGLHALGVARPLADPRLAVFQGAAIDLELDDWRDAPSSDALAATTAAAGAFPLAPTGGDAALVASFPSGALTVHAQSADGSSGVAIVELYEADLDDSTRMANLSARGRVGTGEDILIAGFTVTQGALRVLLRGTGPGLAGFGLSGVLPDPRLALYQGPVLVAENDNWSTAPGTGVEIAAAARAVGAFAHSPGSPDAALLVTLPAGSYTVHLRDREERSGLGLIEIYVVP